MQVADLILMEKVNIALALKAIAEGYPVKGKDDRYIIVENPHFQENDGSAPVLVIDTLPILELLKCMGVTI